MSFVDISDEIAAVRDLMVTEFNKLNREVAGLNTKVAALHKQLQHMALSSDDNNTNDKTVLYTSSALDVTTAQGENSAKFLTGSSTGTPENDEPAEGSKSGSSRKSHRREDSFMSTVSNDAEELAKTPMESIPSSVRKEQLTSVKKRRRQIEVESPYLIETDVTVEYGGKILCDLHGFSLWPKGLLSSQLRQQLKRVPCIRDIIEDSRGELSVQGVSTKGESVDLDDVLEANAVREYERLVVNL